VSAMMNAEGHRRLIGNDIAILIFLEEDEDFTFDPTGVGNLGTVPQVFAVVQPYKAKWRYGFYSLF
jgi:hypothetical protein